MPGARQPAGARPTTEYRRTASARTEERGAVAAQAGRPAFSLRRDDHGAGDNTEGRARSRADAYEAGTGRAARGVRSERMGYSQLGSLHNMYYAPCKERRRGLGIPGLKSAVLEALGGVLPLSVGACLWCAGTAYDVGFGSRASGTGAGLGLRESHARLVSEVRVRVFVDYGLRCLRDHVPVGVGAIDADGVHHVRGVG